MDSLSKSGRSKLSNTISMFRISVAKTMLLSVCCTLFIRLIIWFNKELFMGNMKLLLCTFMLSFISLCFVSCLIVYSLIILFNTHHSTLYVTVVDILNINEVKVIGDKFGKSVQLYIPNDYKVCIGDIVKVYYDECGVLQLEVSYVL